jgi:hypothetical protein
MATTGSGSRTPATDWRTRWAAPPRTSYTTETKPFFLTSEFVVFVLFVMGLAIGTARSRLTVSQTRPDRPGATRLPGPAERD